MASLLQRFLLSGVANTIAGLATIILARTVLGLSDYLANALGYAVGISLGFALHRGYAFRDRQQPIVTAPRYLAAFLLCYFINLFVLRVALVSLHWGSIPAQACAIAAYSICFFLLCRWFVFRPAPASAGST